MANNYYTNRMMEFFGGLRNSPDKGEEFERSIRKCIAEKGLAFGRAEVGGLLLAAVVETVGPTVSQCPGIVQELLARIIASEIDWKVVADQFVADESLN